MSSRSFSQLEQSGSEGGVVQEIVQVDQKKRKRMVSNRESARRSRMRKQKQLDDLVAQVVQLGCEKSHIVTSVKLAGQMYLNLDADNSILRAQLAELTNRLDSLNHIINCFNSTDGLFDTSGYDHDIDPSMIIDHLFLNPLNSINVSQPIPTNTIMANYPIG